LRSGPPLPIDRPDTGEGVPVSTHQDQQDERAANRQIAADLAALAREASPARLATGALEAAIVATGASGGELVLTSGSDDEPEHFSIGDECAGGTVGVEVPGNHGPSGKLAVWGMPDAALAEGRLRILAIGVGQAIAKLQLERLARAQRRRARRFANAVEALRYPVSPPEAVRIVLAGARSLVDAEAALFLTGGGEQDLARYEGVDPLSDEAARALVSPRLRHALEDEGAQLADVPAEHELRARGLTRMVLAGVGVRASLGVLICLDDGGGAPSAEDLQALEDYCVHSAAAMTAAVLGQEVRELGAIDPLTRFFNARYFRSRLEQETQRALRAGSSLSVAAITLDGLAELRLEDQGAADDALERLAESCVPRLRATDVGCRLGENELALILPDVSGLDAYRIGERVRSGIIADAGLGSRWTASVGIATYPDQTGAPEQLADAARRALAWARGHGGDRTFLFSQEAADDLDDARRGADVASASEAAGDSGIVTITALAAEVDERIPGRRGHSERVSRLSAALGAELGLPQDRLGDLRLAGLLHDVGKIGVSDEILTKSGPLSEEEWDEVHRHPEIGHRMLAGARLDAIRPWVLHHHERIDGTGYPAGLVGDEIPLEARILAVANAYDAMTHERPHRDARDRAGTLAEFERCAGSQFDSSVVSALLALATRRAPELDPEEA
jgi:diguanylate cyclase (GGDEF)-like protein